MATSNIVVKFDESSIEAMGRLAVNIQDLIDKVENSEELYHDADTLNKIYPVLYEFGLSTAQITEAIGQLQNAGIMFRERKPND